MSPLAHPKGKTLSRSCNLRKGDFFAPCALPKPLPLGEVALRSNDGEGKPGRKEQLRSDRQALCQSDTIAVPVILGQRPCPLSLVASSSPAPPKGEPLACRSAFVWTLKARRGAKGRALLQRPAASGQRSLSSCRWPRQRSTTVPETSCFARPVGSGPSCQGLSLWESWREAPERAHPGAVTPAARLRGLP